MTHQTARLIVIYCGLLMSASAFTIDITLPSFPAMARDLAAPYFLVQWTLSIFVFLSGAGQLFWGSFSDRFGRRSTLVGGLTIFVAGSLLALFAPTVGWVLAGRAMQGVGAAAAQVCARAMLRDMFSGPALARNLATATAIFAFGPIVAPLVGAVIAHLFGWRSVFTCLAIFGSLLLLAMVFLPETIPQRSPDAMRPAVFFNRIGRLFLNRQSRYFLILAVVVSASMQLILTSIPRLYENSFGIAGMTFAVLFALQGLGIIVGQLTNRRLIGSIGVVRSMLVANSVLLAAAMAMLLLALAGLLHLWLFVAGLVLFTTFYLVVVANATAMVLDPHGEIAGFSSSFFGFLSQMGSSGLIALVILGVGDSLTAFAGTLTTIVALSFVAIYRWERSLRVR